MNPLHELQAVAEVLARLVSEWGSGDGPVDGELGLGSLDQEVLSDDAAIMDPVSRLVG